MDYFKDNKFSLREWSTPQCKTAEENRQIIESLNLKGRTIKKIRMVAGDLDSKKKYAEYKNFDCRFFDRKTAKTFPEVRTLEPFLIAFEDGDQLEILGRFDPDFRVTLNHIPWDIQPCWNQPTVRASKIFEDCIGAKIDGVLFISYMSRQHPYYSYQYSKPKEFIDQLILQLSNNQNLTFTRLKGNMIVRYDKEILYSIYYDNLLFPGEDDL